MIKWPFVELKLDCYPSVQTNTNTLLSEFSLLLVNISTLQPQLLHTRVNRVNVGLFYLSERVCFCSSCVYFRSWVSLLCLDAFYPFKSQPLVNCSFLFTNSYEGETFWLLPRFASSLFDLLKSRKHKCQTE